MPYASPLPSRAASTRPRRLRAAALLAIAAITAAMLAPQVGSTQAATVSLGTLFTPNLAAGEHSGYPRVIRLHQDGKPTTTLLATFTYDSASTPKGSFPIYRSTDNGRSWTSKPISTVVDALHGRDLDTPTLYELPQAAGDLPAGTLLASGIAWNRGDESEQAVQVYVSRDQGSSWTYRSSCTGQTGQPAGGTHGIWEPEFNIAADGDLVCYFSDERYGAAGYHQLLAHTSSSDGGLTWSDVVYDLAIPDGVQRPGMPTVVKLPTGRYAMTYEACKAGVDPNQACEIYIKFSADGEAWNPSDSGTRIETEDHRLLTHTPYITWSPEGGLYGTLIVTGQRVMAGSPGNLQELPESGHVLFINRTLGLGPWTEITTPVTTDPTGGYHTGDTQCVGYSSPLLASSSDATVLMLAGVFSSYDHCRIDFGTATLPLAQGQITGPGASGMCLDVAGNTPTKGNAVQLYTCGGALGQRWSIETDGTIRAFDKCLDITGNSTANATKVQLWDCNGTGGQQWQARADGSLFNAPSGRCLDVPQGQTANLTRVRILDCNGLASQQWYPPMG